MFSLLAWEAAEQGGTKSQIRHFGAAVHLVLSLRNLRALKWLKGEEEKETSAPMPLLATKQ